MLVAVVRIRGIRKVNPKIRTTLSLLGLHKPNHCVLLHLNDSLKGMLQIVKDYVAWGEADKKTVLSLLRFAERGGKKLPEMHQEDELKEIASKICEGDDPNKYFDRVIRLHPPRKGYKSIKLPYPKGDLGKRPDISGLVLRMC